MQKITKFFGPISYALFCALGLWCTSCSDKSDEPADNPVNYDPNIPDDYSSIAGKENAAKWGPYNLHDPSIIKHNGTYYIYSTDVAYGPNGQCGIMFRQSKDLVQWQFNGWLFDGVPAKELAFMQTYQTGYRQESIWAPYIIKVGDQFRLYYSVPGNDNLKLACIGLATSTSPSGPWNDEGIVISCLPSDNYNAIDPSVVVDAETGRHWMTYGSYSSGIYIVELDPATGFRKNTNDKGKLLAFRKRVHDAIEGSEIIYNPELKKYFLFVSYDWLEDTYNVRVGRSDKPEGPYLDYFGNDMAAVGDNFPVITAQYGFKGHPGWQGFGHCGLLRDSNQYFYVSQARLASNKYLMVLHVHRMLFTSDGWPVIAPERYVNVPQYAITADSLVGKWEVIYLSSVTKQNVAWYATFNADGTLTGYFNGENITSSSWNFANNELTLQVNAHTIKARLSCEWDWENKRRTICFTGLSEEGRSAWGKKLYR
ncbi:MAG TPA: arabinan endo-1,5-alpha-L-arabinosidase [Bacteroidales bacterium]|nr:arabinan endo-1,5-alpha-L-arabinosidase [Bacteroidales bacterium]HPO65427.1 arabinan endo-1,5-alpha-L-arabinosidase [Bacteroidales bacterium]